MQMNKFSSNLNHVRHCERPSEFPPAWSRIRWNFRLSNHDSFESHLIMSFISVFCSNYSCCVYNRAKALFFHPSLVLKRQVIHSNYAILMTIKLLIRNKKGLDVAIVDSQSDSPLETNTKWWMGKMSQMWQQMIFPSWLVSYFVAF